MYSLLHHRSTRSYSDQIDISTVAPSSLTTGNGLSIPELAGNHDFTEGRTSRARFWEKHVIRIPEHFPDTREWTQFAPDSEDVEKFATDCEKHALNLLSRTNLNFSTYE